MICAVVISSFSQILLKMSARRNYSSLIREYLNPYVITGYGMMVLSTLLFVAAYRGVDYKNGPVIESLGYIMVMVLSYVFFKERVSRRKIVGYGMILLGVIVFYA